MKKKLNNKKQRTRVYIFKSNKHIYAYIIDDINKKILTSTSSLSISKDNKIFANCTTAKIIGKEIAEKLKNRGLNNIVFDRGNNIYHGQIKALADATRQEGIHF